MRRVMDFVFHILLVLLLCCPFSAKAGLVLYDSRFGNPVGMALEDALPASYTVEGREEELSRFWGDREVSAVELYDFQADVFRRNRMISSTWYPLYMVDIVLAVRNENQDMYSWQDLLRKPVTVCIPADSPRMQMVVMAVSYGMSGEFDPAVGIHYFQKLEREGRLRTDTSYQEAHYLHKVVREKADVYILPDIEAAHWIEQGEKFHLVHPAEGTLSFQRGILSKEILPLSKDISSEKLDEKGYHVSPGEKAYPVQDFLSFAQDIEPIPGQMKEKVFGITSMVSLFRVPHLVYYSGFLFLFILWGGHIRRRMASPRLKRLALVLTVVSVLWIGQRIFKLTVPSENETLLRYLWYSYYIFFSLFVTICMDLGYSQRRRVANYVSVPWILGLGNLWLSLLVLTNDFHQWVFTFPEGFSVADAIHGYGPGYYLILGAYGLQFLWVNGLLFTEAKKQKLLGFRQLLPLGVSVLYGLYVVAYIQGSSLVSYTELVWVTILWAFLWLEFMLDTGLILSNDGYANFFTYSNLAMEIQDAAGHVQYRSQRVPKEPSEYIERMTMPIQGGQVVWYRDVRQLREKQRELKLARDAMQRAYDLDKKEEMIRRSYIKLLMERKIYDELQEVLRTKGALILQYTKFLETAVPGNAADEAVSRLNVLASYIKKRCVMMLRGKEDHSLQGKELYLALQELFRYLERTGLKVLLEFQVEGNLPTEKALALYDFIEQLCESAVVGGENHMVCHVKEEETSYTVKVLLDHRLWILGFMRQIRDDTRLKDPTIRIHCRDLEYAYSVEIQVRKGSEGS